MPHRLCHLNTFCNLGKRTLKNSVFEPRRVQLSKKTQLASFPEKENSFRFLHFKLDSNRSICWCLSRHQNARFDTTWKDSVPNTHTHTGCCSFVANSTQIVPQLLLLPISASFLFVRILVAQQFRLDRVYFSILHIQFSA